VIKLWWQSGSPSGYMDYFPDSSLLGDTESGYIFEPISKRFTRWQDWYHYTGRMCLGRGVPW